jgi:predicted DNA-binding ribbon-helix-helix protein
MMKNRTDEPEQAKSRFPAIRKRSIVIAGHRTSISLEEPFWVLLQTEAKAEETSIATIVARVDAVRRGGNLSSAIRIHLLEGLMAKSRMTET